jgi:hypothetical protein
MYMFIRRMGYVYVHQEDRICICSSGAELLSQDLTGKIFLLESSVKKKMIATPVKIRLGPQMTIYFLERKCADGHISAQFIPD